MSVPAVSLLDDVGVVVGYMVELSKRDEDRVWTDEDP
ncbi:hypothetical protein KIPB_013286, partial [Kipferlia bialata]|eukprot:g13286.t1